MRIAYNFSIFWCCEGGVQPEFLLLCLNAVIHLEKIPGVDQCLISLDNEKISNQVRYHFAGTVA